METLRGQLLIAGPSLKDPNFERGVVLVCEHSDEGALGLVLNRRAGLPAAEAVPELVDVVGDELWVGGPVQPGSVIVLAEFEAEEEGIRIEGDLGLVAAGSDTGALGAVTRRARAFLGYAGWGPGQLDAEVDAQDWITVERAPDDVFDADPDGLWAAALARLGGHFALLATMPPDPSVN